jgi:hypothetical protein
MLDDIILCDMLAPLKYKSHTHAEPTIHRRDPLVGK